MTVMATSLKRNLPGYNRFKNMRAQCVPAIELTIIAYRVYNFYHSYLCYFAVVFGFKKCSIRYWPTDVTVNS